MTGRILGWRARKHEGGVDDFVRYSFRMKQGHRNLLEATSTAFKDQVLYGKLEKQI